MRSYAFITKHVLQVLDCSGTVHEAICRLYLSFLRAVFSLPRFIRDGESVATLMDLGKQLLGRRQVLASSRVNLWYIRIIWYTHINIYTYNICGMYAIYYVCIFPSVSGLQSCNLLTSAGASRSREAYPRRAGGSAKIKHWCITDSSQMRKLGIPRCIETVKHVEVMCILAALHFACTWFATANLERPVDGSVYILP